MEGTNTNPSSNNNNNNDENRNNNSSGDSYFPPIFRRSPFFSPLIAFREINTGNRNNERERERGGSVIGESGFVGRSSLRIISSTLSNIGRTSEYAPQPTVNSDEIRETIAQNLLEVQNMIDYGNYNEFNEEKKDDEEKKMEEENEKEEKEKEKEENEYDMNCFDLNKRILAKGQWVDVKDTVEQWLDAQVIEVSDDNKMVKIHYNRWSTRWDEWIPTNSPRIMPFRYHTRQSTLTNYHSPFPNKKPDMGVTLLSFENLNRNSCVHPSSLTGQRNRNSSVITTSPPQNNSPPPPSNTTNNNTNNNNTNSNEENTNNNQNESFSINNILNITSGRRSSSGRYAEPRPPIPSPKHLEPDPENHIVKNLGEDGFLGVFKEFDQINKVIGGLSSELLTEHNNNTEILTPKKLSDIQNKSYYNLKRLIPILDRTGRIYSDISTFMEHSMKTNQLELLSKNLFADVGRMNEDLKYFSEAERRRVSQDILSHNTRRENRSGTVNFVPPVNKFEAKLVNSIPIIDTPYMTGRNDSQIPQLFDFFIQNNSNNNEEDASSADENNNANNNNANNNNRNNNENTNNNFTRNIQIESFNIEFEGKNEKLEEKEGEEEGEEGEKKKKTRNRNKNNKNVYKMIGIKTKRNKEIKKNDKKKKEEEKNKKKKK